MLGSNDKTTLAAVAPRIAPRQAAFCSRNQKTSCEVSSASSSFAVPCFATVNCEEKSRRKYTLDIKWLIDSSTPPQIWPYLTVLVLSSPLRYAAPAIQTNPTRRRQNAIREPDFLLPK
jgi:hypothetical protein